LLLKAPENGIFDSLRGFTFPPETRQEMGIAIEPLRFFTRTGRTTGMVGKYSFMIDLNTYNTAERLIA
jgi:hypothetical protein